MADFFGYARVSTADQNPDLQHDALRAAGCSRIFTDHASGMKTARPELTRALEHLRGGDTLIVWKLDRLEVLSEWRVMERGLELRGGVPDGWRSWRCRLASRSMTNCGLRSSR